MADYAKRMTYDKKTLYLDLKENSQVVGNGGFAKIIVQNGQIRLTINICGLHKTDTFATDIFFNKVNKPIPIDSIHIKEGRSVYSRLFTADELHSMGVEWDKIYSMYIKIDDSRMLEAIINPDALLGAEESPVEEEDENVLEIKKDKEEPVIETDEVKIDVVRIEEAIEEKEVNKTDKLDVDTDHVIIEKVSENNNNIYEDKWKQLESVFPHIHPFGDDRDFLSVKPRDFVVLTKEYQPLAGNSFLLHGFYNYNHVILGKMQSISGGNINGESYYIGVPGVYYEREKAVAVMFGFDSFECNREPATIGTFGYYMKKVEI